MSYMDPLIMPAILSSSMMAGFLNASPCHGTKRCRFRTGVEFFMTLQTLKGRRILKREQPPVNLMTNITRHDVLNKITVILGYIGIGRSKTKDPKVLSILDKLESATEAIKYQILFTKMYQELGAREPAWQDPRQLVQQLQVPANISCSLELGNIELLAVPDA